MKKLFAISMLLVYLFNLAGYNFFYYYHIKLADRQIADRADNNQYAETELTELKIKLNLPYQRDRTSYERFDGEIELNGVTYIYVKRKVSQDTLYLLCLPNKTKTQLLKQKADYASNTSDAASEKQGTHNYSKKGPLSNEFKNIPMSYDFYVDRIPDSFSPSHIFTRITDPFISASDRPPQALS